MSKAKKGFLPRMEVLIVLVFFFSFIIWAVSKCGDTKALYEQAAELAEGEDAESAEPSAEETELPATATSGTASTTTPASGAESTTTTTPATDSKPASTRRSSLNDGLSRLYITIDELNMRTAPHLDSPVVMKLPLFEQVYFLNEVTDFKQEISLGTEMANEPWVKIRQRRGFEGWVYGAGVHYHKQRREGTQ